MKHAIIAIVLATVAIAGCGGGSDSTDSSSSGKSAVTNARVGGALNRKAEAFCAEMVAAATRMGAEFRDGSVGSSDPLTMTTERLIKPAIPIVEKGSAKLRGLGPSPTNVHFESYVKLFDPILSLLRDRVEAGEAGEGDHAHELELQLIELSALQRSLARQAGLDACDVDFVQTFAGTGNSR